MDLDQGADGTIDVNTTTSYCWTGHPIRWSEDEDADGVTDKTAQWAYDRHGRLVQTAVDENSDGLPDVLTDYAYDAAGRLTSIRLNARDWRYREYFIYDSTGKLVLISYDEDGDDGIDGFDSFLYDRSDRLTKEERSVGDAGDHHTDVYTYIWSSDLLVLVEVDLHKDGSTDTTYELSYDSHNRLSRLATFGADGRIADREVYYYDALGRLAFRVLYGSGNYHESWTYEYDEFGRLVKRRYDSAVYWPRLVWYTYSTDCTVAPIDPIPCLHPVTCDLFSFIPRSYYYSLR